MKKLALLVLTSSIVDLSEVWTICVTIIVFGDAHRIKLHGFQ